MQPKRLVIPAVALTSIAISACGGSVSIGNNVSQAEAEKQAKAVIAKDVGVPVAQVPEVSCPGDLKAEVGTVMTCDFGPVDGQMGKATLTVTAVDGSNVRFNVKTSAN